MLDKESGEMSGVFDDSGIADLSMSFDGSDSD